MADDGMDLCENLWNHELAMRRLLSLLRQGQAYCTDSECLEELPGLGGQGSGESLMMMGFLVVSGVVLYMMRARATPQRATDTKSYIQGPSGPPPPPPAAPTT